MPKLICTRDQRGHPTYLEGMKNWIPYLEHSLADIKRELDGITYLGYQRFTLAALQHDPQV